MERIVLLSCNLGILTLREMKNKYTAGTLALFLGIFGTHRFYLGQRFLGVVHFLMFLVGLLGTLNGGHNPEFFMAIPAIVGFLDAILLYAMPREDFDRKYNKRYLQDSENYMRGQRAYQAIWYDATPASPPPSKFEWYKSAGIEQFRAGDYPGAVAAFLEALRIRPGDPAILFNLACAHSQLAQVGPALYYLEEALKNGFDHHGKILQHPALAFLRRQEAFQPLHAKYLAPRPAQEEATAEAFLDLSLQEPAEIPEPLLQLENLKQRGILTEEEFELQRQKILGYR